MTSLTRARKVNSLAIHVNARIHFHPPLLPSSSSSQAHSQWNLFALPLSLSSCTLLIFTERKCENNCITCEIQSQSLDELSLGASEMLASIASYFNMLTHLFFFTFTITVTLFALLAAAAVTMSAAFAKKRCKFQPLQGGERDETASELA